MQKLEWHVHVGTVATRTRDVTVSSAGSSWWECDQYHLAALKYTSRKTKIQCRLVIHKKIRQTPNVICAEA